MSVSNHRRVCHLCTQDFGQERSLHRHLREVHQLSGTLKKIFDDAFHSGAPPGCACGHCDLSPKWNSWVKGYNRYVDGHSGYIDSLGVERAEQVRESRRSRQKGRVGWSKGLTKDTDPRLAKAATKRSETVKAQFASGQRQTWNRGLTKETSESVRKNAQKVSQAYSEGRITPWAKGLTKESSDKVRKMAVNVSKALSEPGIRKQLDEQKRRSPERIMSDLSKQAPDLKMLSNVTQYVRDRLDNLTFQCQRCSDIRQRSLLSALTNRCYACQPEGSGPQLEINDFIRSLKVNTILCSRNVIPPLELDIWVPRFSLAVEYNGLYWHSEACQADHRYHTRKTDLCKAQGIDLFHVFGDEWRDKRDIVKSMISHKLGLTANKIGARSCRIVKLDTQQRRSFFDGNHIDGDTRAKTCFALQDGNGQVVAALSLRKPRQVKYDGLLEVARSCSKIGTSVPGGLSRLIRSSEEYASLEGYRGLMTYVDLRHGSGKSYENGGFQIVSQTRERFWWTDDVYRYDRFRYRADNRLGLTQAQVAERAGVKRIFGCPNVVMTTDALRLT